MPITFPLLVYENQLSSLSLDIIDLSIVSTLLHCVELWYNVILIFNNVQDAANPSSYVVWLTC